MTTVRNIVKIDEERCNGCGLCVTACAEGALRVVDGKARLVSEVYCDGLGACLGECPQGAITIERREAEAFDEAATVEHISADAGPGCPGAACPGSAVRSFLEAQGGRATCPAGRTDPTDRTDQTDRTGPPAASGAPACPRGVPSGCGACCLSRASRSNDGAAELADQPPPSQLGHWPIQLKLVPPSAPFLEGADLVVCADCVAFAVPDFHARYIAGHAVLVGCPKLDDVVFYGRKLREIFAAARPAGLTVLRMEVPCCAALAQAAIAARDAVLPDLPVEVHTIGIRGGISRVILSGPGGEDEGRDLP